MRILQIASSYFPVIGGQEKVVYEISKGLVKRGHDVTILTTDLLVAKKNFPREEIVDRIKIIRLKNDFFLGGYGYSKQALKWLKKNYKKYDIVHSHGYNRHLSEFAIRFLWKKIPTIFSPHGFIHTKKNLLFKKIHDLTIGKFLRKANYCTALTKLDYKEYFKLGVKKEKIKDFPNGVDVKKFSKKDEKEIKKLKEKFGKFILYVGRIHESKGLQYVVKALKDLNVNLVIVGEDAGYKKPLKEIIKDLGLRKKVFFVRGITNKTLISFYQTCKLFVLFSEWEGFGIVVIEAMAAGKPVIASDKGSLPYVVRNKKTGFVIQHKNIKLLKEKIKELLDDKKLRQTLGKQCKLEVKKYEWAEIIKRYEKLYENAKDNQ